MHSDSRNRLTTKHTTDCGAIILQPALGQVHTVPTAAVQVPILGGALRRGGGGVLAVVGTSVIWI